MKLKMKNDPRIEFTPFFDKQRKAAPLEIKEAFLETLALFLAHPDHPTLRNHLLKEKFAGYRSIDVTEDWRAVFKETYAGERKLITFHMIGTHHELYG
jgi:mRNA-degrading endonuclease YafQ of YafQ-DinJ toxin-antitoxin module